MCDITRNVLVMIRRRADSSRVGAVSGNCNNLLWYGLMSSRSKCLSGSLRLESVFSTLECLQRVRAFQEAFWPGLPHLSSAQASAPPPCCALRLHSFLPLRHRPTPRPQASPLPSRLFYGFFQLFTAFLRLFTAFYGLLRLFYGFFTAFYELALGHLHYHVTSVPPQPNSPPD